MFYLLLSGLFFSCVLVFLGKAVADIVESGTHWYQSIFSSWGEEDSFWGYKKATADRKDHDNFILNYFFHTILVPLTDVWHMANTVRRVGIYLSVTFGFLIGRLTDINHEIATYILLGYVILNMIGFHYLYHTALRKKQK